MSIDRLRAARAIDEFLRALGRDPAHDPALAGTGERVTQAWIDDLLLRIETTPRLVPEQEQFAAFWGGDPKLFDTLRAVLLAPLHARIGIAAVRMGGYVQRRA